MYDTMTRNNMFLVERIMSYHLKLSVLALSIMALGSAAASAQYYVPQPAVQNHSHFPVGIGINPGFQPHGLYPNVGFGVGPVGTGASVGIGRHGAGAGANVGFGPIGVSTDAGIGRNGFGTRGNLGIGNTGAGIEGGVSNSGLGVGAGAQIFGFGPSASAGVGNKGLGLGASVAFGPIGTLQIGSHRNSYPGARLASIYANPAQTSSFYQQQNYGANPYYRPAPIQRVQHKSTTRPVSYIISRCQGPWIC